MERKLIVPCSDGWFDRDGVLTKFFEQVPIVGFIVGGIHMAAGNTEHGMRAMAVCANSTIICVGIAIGACFGGPAGAIIGAALTTIVGTFAEERIVNLWITNPGLKAEFEEATVGRCVYEALRNVLGAGAGVYIGEWLASLAPAEMDIAAVAVLKQLGSKIDNVADLTVYKMLQKVVDKLRGVSDIPEWDEATRKVSEILAKQ